MPEFLIPKVPSLPCPEPGCGGMLRLRESRYGPFYGCTNYPRCKGSHGAHPDGKPLGVPVSFEVKQARIEAHAAFDQLWKGPQAKMRRRQAYAWMRRTLGLGNDEAHIGRFGVEECRKLVLLVEQEIPGLPAS